MQFTPIDYLSAALALEISIRTDSAPINEIVFPATISDAKLWLNKEYKIDDDKLTNIAIKKLSEVGFINIDSDKYAGLFIEANSFTFFDRWNHLTSKFPKSPYNRAKRGGREWLQSVFDNDLFWDDLIRFLNNQPTIESTEHSDEIIKIEPNEDYEQLLNGLDSIKNDLLRDNEISEHLGEEKDRIKSEIEASEIILKSKNTRKGLIINLIGKILRELITKLKDKFAEKLAEYGVEKLFDLALRLVNQLN